MPVRLFYTDKSQRARCGVCPHLTYNNAPWPRLHNPDSGRPLCSALGPCSHGTHTTASQAPGSTSANSTGGKEVVPGPREQLGHSAITKRREANLVPVQLQSERGGMRSPLGSPSCSRTHEATSMLGFQQKGTHNRHENPQQQLQPTPAPVQTPPGPNCCPTG